MSVSKKALYGYRVRNGTKKLRFRVALVDEDLNIQSKCIFESLLGREISAIAQISSDKAIAQVYDMDNDKTEFYEFNFAKNNFVQIDSPFPKMSIVDNFITVDDGKSFYLKETQKRGISGLFHYNCVTNKVMPALLDVQQGEQVNHVVNFCLIKQA